LLCSIYLAVPSLRSCVRAHAHPQLRRPRQGIRKEPDHGAQLLEQSYKEVQELCREFHRHATARRGELITHDNIILKGRSGVGRRDSARNLPVFGWESFPSGCFASPLWHPVLGTRGEGRRLDPGDWYSLCASEQGLIVYELELTEVKLKA
jgi:hypothetical protein